MPSSPCPPTRRKPWGLKWRSSVWFITLVVGSGISTDLLVYSIVVPVLPFRLEALKYHGVSGLIGWILFAYSAGSVASTLPIAAFSEKYHNRKWPLLVGEIIFAASQIMLMEAPAFWVMVLARVIQGISSSVIWIVGLALLCDTAPEETVGRQLGLAMAGFSFGFLVGPPVGGALYTAFGFRGPFIFGVVVVLLDFIGRLLIIERKDAEKYSDLSETDPPNQSSLALCAPEERPPQVELGVLHSRSSSHDIESSTITTTATTTTTSTATPLPQPPRLSLVDVILTLGKSPRALAVLTNTLIYGIVFSAQEPAIPLHLQRVWKLTSSKVGMVYIAAVVPTFISSPLTGWYTDRKGPEWITLICLALSMPWWIVVTIQGPLALFIIALALQSFFTSGVVSPLTAELAAVSRRLPGVGYGHVYGAFNLSFAIGASVGPLLGGQIFQHLKHGWLAICLIAVALFGLSSILVVCFTGDKPLLTRAVQRVTPVGEIAYK